MIDFNYQPLLLLFTKKVQIEFALNFIFSMQINPKLAPKN